jgi:hypothetical protein
MNETIFQSNIELDKKNKQLKSKLDAVCDLLSKYESFIKDYIDTNAWKKYLGCEEK